MKFFRSPKKKVLHYRLNSLFSDMPSENKPLTYKPWHGGSGGGSGGSGGAGGGEHAAIASYHECLKNAKALLDVGCPSLMSLVALPELKKDPINSLEDVQSHLQNLRYPLGKLQFIRILRWIQQQRQMPASNVDVGSQSHQ